MPFYSPWGGGGMPNESMGFGQILLAKKMMENQQRLQQQSMGLQMREQSLREEDAAMRSAVQQQQIDAARRQQGAAGDVGQSMMLGNALSRNVSAMPESVQQPTLQQAFQLLQKAGLWQPPADGSAPQMMPQEQLRGLLASVGQGKAGAMTAEHTPGQLLQRDFVRPGETVMNRFSSQPEMSVPPLPGKPVAPPRGTVVPRGGMYVPPGQQESVTNPYESAANMPPGALLNFGSKAMEFPENFSPEMRGQVQKALGIELQRYITAGQQPTPPAVETAKKAATGAKPGNPYQIGKQYGNLRYKGGDPENETSWEPVTPGIQY